MLKLLKFPCFEMSMLIKISTTSNYISTIQSGLTLGKKFLYSGRFSSKKKLQKMKPLCVHILLYIYMWLKFFSGYETTKLQSAVNWVGVYYLWSSDAAYFARNMMTIFKV